ncbi:MAG: hypothetical protein E6Q55_33745 [Mycolicibacterium mageritense]|nr:MAG: hypothetical protein E6Q55_33745 [Mycolicibacterium mageritense]
MTTLPYSDGGAPPRRKGPTEQVTVAFIVPMQGSGGLHAPSCTACGEFAVHEINAGGGILGRPLDLVPVDGGQPPETVANQVAALVASNSVQAIAGWHSSAVRRAITRRVGGKVIYAYAAEHEDDDHTPGLFMVGERPVNQLLPAINWMHDALGTRRWALVGSDYVYPRIASQAVRAGMPDTASVTMSSFVPLGTTDFTTQLDAIEQHGPDAVFMLLIGEDAVHFNRQFAERGLSASMPRLATTVEENILIAGDVMANDRLYSAKAFFDSTTTLEGRRFADRYYARFGPYAPPLNGVGESCYEALHLLACIARYRGSLDVKAVDGMRSGYFYESPRGLMRIWGTVVSQDVYIAAAGGLEFTIQDQIART